MVGESFNIELQEPDHRQQLPSQVALWGQGRSIFDDNPGQMTKYCRSPLFVGYILFEPRLQIKQQLLMQTILQAKSILLGSNKMKYNEQFDLQARGLTITSSPERSGSPRFLQKALFTTSFASPGKGTLTQE